MTPHELLARAADAAGGAYAPYSRFRVGAALVTAGGALHVGANVENASYGLSMCAERVAVFAMAAVRPSDRTVHAVAVASPDAAPCFPCGACRQVLTEFGCAHVFVLEDGEPRRYELGALLPFAFGAQESAS